jgi:hypothetical protein
MPSMLSELQRQFAAALLDAESLPPTGILSCEGRVDARRFAVHRNNLFVGLIDALATRFPVSQQLVGMEFFRSLARAYVALERPRSPILLDYGDGFPDFIASFPPANGLPYLADVARLEAARSSAYHSTDAVPLQIEAIASFRPEELLEARISLHPSLRQVRSPYPIATIWAAHQDGHHIEPPARWEAEAILVVRPEAEVLILNLLAGGDSFVAALISGKSLSEAGEVGLLESKDFDLGRTLTALFTVGAIVEITIGQCQGGRQ